MTYLPVTFQTSENDKELERSFRENLARIINEFSKVLFDGAKFIIRELLNEEISIEDISNRIVNDELVVSKIGYKEIKQNTSKAYMKLVALNTATNVGVEISKDVFILGRNTFVTDENIPFNNKMIGRIHCKIVKSDNDYMVEDLKSMNGTFINGLKLEPNQLYPIKNGDILKLANTQFRVVID